VGETFVESSLPWGFSDRFTDLARTFGRQSAAGGVVDTPAGPILTGAINKIRQAHPEIGEQW